MPQESRIDLSIIIPIYNEAKFINRLFDDGTGFKKDIIDKLGEPYISKNY